jgi:hypothetical protein
MIGNVGQGIADGDRLDAADVGRQGQLLVRRQRERLLAGSVSRLPY